MLFRRAVAFALFCLHMDQDRAVDLGSLPQDRDQRPDIVAVHGAQIGNAHVFEQHAGDHQLLDGVLGPGDLFHHAAAHHGDPVQGLLGVLLESVVAFGRPQLGQVGMDASHVAGDGHVVVVQNNDKVGLPVSGVVEGLVGHAACQGSVADDGNDLIVLSQKVSGLDKAQACRHGGGAVAGIEGVVFRLPSLGKAADAAVLAQIVKAALASAQDLVGIGLVSHVPDQLVFGKVEDPVHGDGQLDYPQVGGQMASVFAGLLDQKSADLSRQKLQLAVGQLSDVRRSVYLIKDHNFLSFSFCSSPL